MNKDKISIVVPIYNVEKFLPRCIDSLINQSYENIEILLIDDGSTDNCSKICDEYAYKYNNIKVFHKKNGGLSDARNYGIERVESEYIAFVDSDDFVDKDYCKILYKNLIENNADISICKFRETTESKIEEVIKQEVINIYSKFDAQQNILDTTNNLNTITTVAWNKLYKKKLWENIRYPKGKVNEDEFVIHHLIHNSNKVVYTNLELYYYYQRENSIMKKNFTKERLVAIEAFKDRWKFYTDNKEYKELEAKAYSAYMKMIISMYFLLKESNIQSNNISKEDCKNNSLDNKEEAVSLINLYRKDYTNRIKIGIKERAKLAIFYVMPGIYYFLQMGVRNVRKSIRKDMSK